MTREPRSPRDPHQTAMNDGWNVLYMDPEYGGHCPCARVVLDGADLRLHCWRVCDECAGCGIHYVGAVGRAAAERVKPLMDAMDWYGEWALAEGFDAI